MANKSETEMRVTCSPFAAGDMGQISFDEQAQQSFEQYSQTFGKYLSGKEVNKDFSEEQREKKERAKKANKIYKQVCEDLQLSACFFSNFGDWSEYVDGKMSDAEFQDHAVTRALQMMAEQN